MEQPSPWHILYSPSHTYIQVSCSVSLPLSHSREQEGGFWLRRAHHLSRWIVFLSNNQFILASHLSWWEMIGQTGSVIDCVWLSRIPLPGNGTDVAHIGSISVTVTECGYGVRPCRMKGHSEGLHFLSSHVDSSVCPYLPHCVSFFVSLFLFGAPSSLAF